MKNPMAMIEQRLQSQTQSAMNWIHHISLHFITAC